MNVCMLIWNYWPGREGGSEKQCRQLTHGLRACGCSCEVVTHRSALRPPRRTWDGDVPVHRLGILSPLAQSGVRLIQRLKAALSGRATAPSSATPSDPRPEKPRFGPSVPLLYVEKLCFMMEAAAFLWRRRKHIDVIHVHESHWIAGFAEVVGRWTRLPVLVKEASHPVLMDMGLDVPFRKTFDRRRRRARYLAQTEVAAAALTRAGATVEAVIPNAVNMPERPADVAVNSDVLYVGNLRQGASWKAFDVLFAAWKIVVQSRPEARLVVVGEAEDDTWPRHVGTLGLDSSVHFAGKQEDVGIFYARAAMLVLPSRREGMSNALLESQSWGLPAVVSDIPANVALVEHGRNGLVAEVDSAPALAESILALLGDPNLRARLGTLARTRAEAGFSMSRVAARVVSAYVSVIEKHGRP